MIGHFRQRLVSFRVLNRDGSESRVLVGLKWKIRVRMLTDYGRRSRM